MKQVITQQDLYIPQEIFQYVISVMKACPNKELFKFSYQNLFKLALQYDYWNAKQFKENLAKYSDRGSYYILYCEYNYKTYYKNLSSILSDYQITSIYKSMYNSFGLTQYGFVNKLNNASDKNCISIINKSVMHLDDWIGTVQHQMTHFIQRVIGLNETICKTYQNIIPNDIQRKIYEFAVYIYLNAKINNKKRINGLANKIKYFIAKNEIQQTIKSLLLMFQNIYQRNITFVNGKIQNISLKPKNIEDRNNWLTTFLQKLNSKEYLQSIQFKDGLNLWQKKSINCNQEQLINHRYFSYILIYLSIKRLLPSCDIDKKLFEHFKSF